LSKSPCKNCVDRHLKCHSTCEKYLAFRKELDDLREVVEKKKRTDNDYFKVRTRHLGR
jgi:hypothetical protein